MFVWLNSIYALVTCSMWVICELVVLYGVDSPGHPFFILFFSESPIKYFAWGVFEQTTSYVLFYILPILLAIKFRTSRNFATMAGTLIGVITVLTYMVHYISFTLFAKYSFKHHPEEPPLPTAEFL